MDVSVDARVEEFLLWAIRGIAVAAFTLAMWLRDRVRKHDNDLYGDHGKNGHRQRLKDLEAEIVNLKMWRHGEETRERTISEIEEELMRDAGRLRSQRLRDSLKPDQGP